MKNAVTLLLCIFLTSVTAHPVDDQKIYLKSIQVTGNLTLDNGVERGDWGPDAFCKEGSYARDIEAKFEAYSVEEIDETAVNAVNLTCMVPGGHHTGTITSTIGKKGEWMGIRSCQEGLMTGMRAKVLELQGSGGDDVAVQNVEMECNYDIKSSVLAIREDISVRVGNWSEWAYCDEGSAICGIKVRYEKPRLFDDTVGVSDLVMFCCELKKPPTTTTHTTEEITTTEIKTTTQEPQSETSTPEIITTTEIETTSEEPQSETSTPEIITTTEIGTTTEEPHSETSTPEIITTTEIETTTQEPQSETSTPEQITTTEIETTTEEPQSETPTTKPGTTEIDTSTVIPRTTETEPNTVITTVMPRTTETELPLTTESKSGPIILLI